MDVLWSSSWFHNPSAKNNIQNNQRLQELNCSRNLDLLSSGSDQAPKMSSKVGFWLKRQKGSWINFCIFFWLDLGPFFCLSFFWLLKFAWIFYTAFFCGLKLEDVIGNMKSDIPTVQHQNLIEGNGPCRPGPKFQTKLLWGERGWWWNAPPCASARNLFGKLFERWNWEEMCVLGTKITVKLLATNTCDMSLPCHTYQPRGVKKQLRGSHPSNGSTCEGAQSWGFIPICPVPRCQLVHPLDDFQQVKKD